MAYLLIVDDDEEFANAVAKVLRGARHEVKIALDTCVALRDMERRCPDLVILDVKFTENASAGLELARTMRASQKQYSKVPILMLTAVDARPPLGFNSDDADTAWIPAAEFLEKPVDFDALRDRVAALLQSPPHGPTSVVAWER